MAFEDTSHTASQDALPPGTVLGDTYRIERQIALGGMAEVYRAINIHTDEPVAVKVVLPEFARDQTILSLFKKEATVLSRLHNDAIVHYQVFSVDRALNRPFLVMEFVDGMPLSDMIRNTPMAPSRARQLMIRIATGLSAAHQLGVVHRDLSPDNVILPGGDVSRTKIIDFGIAKAAVGGGTLLGGKFAGKYNFVSPEQLGLFGGDITERSDIYSLGLVLAAALLGAPIDMSGSHLDVIQKRQTIPDLSGIDPSFRPIVASLLEPDPDRRPQSMRAILDMFSVAPSAPVAPPDTGTVFGGEMPPLPADPWAAPVSPHERSIPPSGRSIPPSGRSVPPSRSYPPDSGSMPSYPRSVPPSARSTPPFESRSEPTQFMAEPPQARSIPPAQRTSPMPGPGPAAAPAPIPTEGMSLQPVDISTLRGSESPFGRFDPDRRAAPLPPIEKTRKGGAPIGAILVVVAIVILGGGGFFAYQQHLFGGGGAPSTPTTPDSGGSVSTPDSTGTASSGSTATGASIASTDNTATPTVAPDSPGPRTTTSTRPTATSTATPTTPATPATPVTPATPGPTIVASTGAAVVPKLDKAADQIAWLNAYPLDDCQYAAVTKVADNSFNVEAFGTSKAPFNKLSDAFEKQAGFAPNINLRQISDAQCQAVDFINSLKDTTLPGPSLSLSNQLLANGGRLNGSLLGTSGWSTELLVIDDQGNVYNVSGVVKPGNGGATFDLPVSLNGNAASSAPLPTLVMAISSKTPIAAANFTDAGTVWTTLRDIGKEIRARSLPVAISTDYFQVSPTPAK